MASLTISAVKQQIFDLALQGGKALLHHQFPNDFEYYLVAFELINWKGETIDLFTFPVLPSKLTIYEPRVKNIRKTFDGITTIKTSSFVPIDISMSGTFGRKFRFRLDNQLVNAAGIAFSTDVGIYTKEQLRSQSAAPVFAKELKTGYGCYQILRAIFDKSDGLDPNGKPLSLLFYNLASNQSYIVEAMSFQGDQDENSNNMLWQYSLAFRAVAPVSDLKDKGEDPWDLIGPSLINQGLTLAADTARSIIANTII